MAETGLKTKNSNLQSVSERLEHICKYLWLGIFVKILNNIKKNALLYFLQKIFYYASVLLKVKHGAYSSAYQFLVCSVSLLDHMCGKAIISESIFNLLPAIDCTKMWQVCRFRDALHVFSFM